jgi:hypothetical protein
MHLFRIFLGGLTILAAAASSSVAIAAAPAAAEPEIQSTHPAIITANDPFQLDVEMTVKNWFLCISQPFAEKLVQAREVSVEKANAAYEELKTTRSCGQFSEMHVILEQNVYQSAPGSEYRGRIFNARINFAGAWANGFVVSDGQ